MAAGAHSTDIIDEAASLSNEMLGLCRDALLTSIKFTNRPLAQLPHRIQMERSGCMTDGREALFSPAFVLNSFNNGRQIITRAYLHMIVHCLLRHPFPTREVDPLTWTVACDLAVGRLLNAHGAPFETFVEADDPDDPDGGTHYKEEYQKEYDTYYDKEYARVAKLMKFDYCQEDGVAASPEDTNT